MGCGTLGFRRPLPPTLNVKSRMPLAPWNDFVLCVQRSQPRVFVTRSSSSLSGTIGRPRDWPRAGHPGMSRPELGELPFREAAVLRCPMSSREGRRGTIFLRAGIAMPQWLSLLRGGCQRAVPGTGGQKSQNCPSHGGGGWKPQVRPSAGP